MRKKNSAVSGFFKGIRAFNSSNDIVPKVLLRRSGLTRKAGVLVPQTESRGRGFVEAVIPPELPAHKIAEIMAGTQESPHRTRRGKST